MNPSSFLDRLDSNARLTRTPSGTWLPRQAQLLEVGSIKIRTKADVPLVPPSPFAQTSVGAGPHRAEVHLRQEGKFVLAWLHQSLQIKALTASGFPATRMP